MTHVPFLVIGAGGVGGAAAYQLARRGLKPLVLEQFRVAHDRGSSFGHSRIFRLAYANPVYAGLALQSLASWRELERLSGAQLLTQTGGLDLGPTTTSTLSDTMQALQNVGAVAEQLSRADLARRYPQWQVPEHWEAVYTPTSGVVNPSLTVELHAALTRAYGGQVLEDTRVERIELGRQPKVYSSAGVFSCDHLIVAAGAWTAQLLPELQDWFTVTLAASSYYQPLKPGQFTPEHFPIFIAHDEVSAYGFPSFGLPGVKIGVDVSRPVVTGDLRPFTVPEDIARASDDFMRRYLPDAAGGAMSRATCLITRAPSTDFLLAKHPECASVTVTSPCSGHGFKFMPLLGELTAALALDEAHAALPAVSDLFGWPSQNHALIS